MNERFNAAYVTMVTKHDLDTLRVVANKIVFITTGYENTLPQIQESIEKQMKTFDPEMDVIVPDGKSITNILVGRHLETHFASMRFNFAIYKGNGEYEVIKL